MLQPYDPRNCNLEAADATFSSSDGPWRNRSADVQNGSPGASTADGIDGAEVDLATGAVLQTSPASASFHDHQPAGVALKEAFDEAYVAEGLDPLDGALQTFDWDMLYRRLAEDVSNGDLDKQLAEVVTRLLQILIPFRQGRIHPVSIGLNITALAWVLNPAYFDGSPSLRDLARRCGIQPSTLARHTGHYSRFIGWRNRGQRHAWNWQAEEVPGTTRSESFAEPGEHDPAGSPTTDQPAEPDEAVGSLTIEQAETSP